MSTAYDEEQVPRPRRPRRAPPQKGTNVWKWLFLGCGGISLLSCGLVVAGIVAGVNWLGKQLDDIMPAPHPVFAKHAEGAVRSVTYSPDGGQIASASGDGTIRIWNVETGASIVSIKVIQGNIKPLAFSPDGTRLAIGGQTYLPNAQEIRGKNPPASGGATIWDAATGKELLSLTEAHKQLVVDLAYSPDGTRLATTSSDITVVWDANAGKKLLVLEGASGAGCVAFSPDGTRLVTATRSGTVRLWNTATGEEEWKIHINLQVDDKQEIKPQDEGKQDNKPQVEDKKEINPQEEDDKEVKPEDEDKKEIKPKVAVKKNDEICRARFSPDGKQILAVGWNSSWMLDTATGDVIRKTGFLVAMAIKAQPTERAINTSTNQIAAVYDNWAFVFDATTGQQTHKLRTKVSFSLAMAPGRLWCVAFSPDGTHMVMGGQDGEIRVWKLNE